MRLRKASLKSQEQLAEESDLSTRAIQELEGNYQQPLINTVYSIAKALDMDPVEFFRLIIEDYEKNGKGSFSEEEDEGDL
ncbi:helix-turn-helix domain-containing protein [Mesobacillus campisalis]|uniref:helix-turn-helix domain-containing protein n=1 Tax=Mesobacillus campisalis TaxID=1408103 RepID=UPI00138ED35D|nr:helix-turn-helix transcriptional regulator [Mesobacillus campisalis]